MKFKLTSQFLMSILIIVIIVFFLNTVIIIAALLYQSTQGVHDMSKWSGEDFARSYTQFISIDDGTPRISDEGLAQLQERQGWIQFLNAEGHVVADYFAPAQARTHYTPVELVHVYKYQEDIDTIIFIGEKEPYSYLIGLQDAGTKRIAFTYNVQSLLETTSRLLIVLIVVDLFVAALIGLLFSTILTRPVTYMIERIEKLKLLDFQTMKPKRTGIYGDVFHNLNDVSYTLEAHEQERFKLEKMRSEWIANVSHDMKTPLASIRGYAELLRDDVTDVERREYVAVIERQSTYMSELLEDLSLTMKLRDNQLTLQQRDVKLASFLRELLIDLLNDVTYEQRDLRLTKIDETIVAQIDEHLMRRALLNFLHNALHYNPPTTTITVSLSLIYGDAAITIHDNGNGIRQEEIGQLFERYYRGSHTDNIQGTGLGMAIARDIIEAHGGTVTLDSTLGVGTTITVRLPLAAS